MLYDVLVCILILKINYEWIKYNVRLWEFSIWSIMNKVYISIVDMFNFCLVIYFI